MSKKPTIEEAAQRFDAVLREWLTPVEYTSMLMLNRTPAYAGNVCASHDYCDANMAMAEALGEEFWNDDVLWCGAWSAWKEGKR
jgi:hypothetical protein